MSIKKVLSSVLSSQPNRVAVEKLVDVCYRFALAYLRQKVRRGRLRADLFGLPLEDLALDCFAELFQRDEQGRFVQLCTYFDGIDWRNMESNEIQMALRRLVFSKVNDGLFRRYRKVDSSLAKLIRNIKNAVKANDALTLVRRRGELWLVVGEETDDLDKLPTAPTEIIESFLTARLCATDDLRATTAAFIEFTEQRPFYSKGYPLTLFAQAMRTAYVHMAATSDEDSSESSGFLPYEVEQAIQHATDWVRVDMHRSYVGKGKVDSATFSAYIQAIGDILTAQFMNDSLAVDSYFDALQTYMPGLSKGDYREEHRYRLEYLAKISRNQMLDYLRDEPHALAA